MNILITGVAGFIGMHVAIKLLKMGFNVVGIDNLNDYYDVKLKLARISEVSKLDNFEFFQIDIGDNLSLNKIFQNSKFDHVINLAGQAGVRYSIENPSAYIQSNLVGFGNLIELCKLHSVKQLTYASSSSVYGSNEKIPFSINDRVDNPISLYAATKKANELIAHSYSYLFGLRTVGLRFFTVYGPWGRPDMSTWLFTSAILEGKAIDIFNYGEMSRDFTFIDDVVEGVIGVLDYSEQSKKASIRKTDNYKIYNIGNNKPTDLLDFVSTLEEILGCRALKRLLPMAPGDVKSTFADISETERDTGFKPKTILRVGLEKWVDWYKKYTKDLK